MKTWTALTCIVVATVACYDPSYRHPLCSAAGACPDGLVCGTDNYCALAVETDGLDAGMEGRIIPNESGSQTPRSTSPSCESLASTCGANDDCCNSPEVPGGFYYRSYDVSGDGSCGQMTSPATVSTFRLDKYAITVGRFRAFLAAGRGLRGSAPSQDDGAHPRLAHSGWDTAWNSKLLETRAQLSSALKCDSRFQTWTDVPAGHEDRPLTCLSWEEAMAFCIWDGGYLPTEAEWNYAAAGGDQQRAYPWSDPDHGSLVWDQTRASYRDDDDCMGDGQLGCAADDLLPVGSRPLGDGRWGQADLSGNVWEWMLDWDADYLTDCDDCAGLAPAARRIQRGGSFINGQWSMRTGYRYSSPDPRSYNVGARCARPAVSGSDASLR